MKRKYIPDRKVLAGGITGVLAFFVVMVARHYGIYLDAEVATGLVSILIAAVSYFTPPSVDDIAKRLDEDLKKLGKD